MRVGFVQYKVVFGNIRVNQTKIKELIQDQSFDLLVFPELALSGYLMSSRDQAFELAEDYGRGETFDFFRWLSGNHAGAVVFGFAERAGNKVYNSAAAVLPDGQAHLYRKTHLFNEEKLWFDQGDTGFTVFDYQDARVGMMICFDWIFPEAARTLMLKGAEVIAHPSNLIFPHCQSAMVTRSLENRVFSITCNRIGADRQGNQELRFTGRSQILNTKGETLAAVGNSDEVLKIVEIDPALARDKKITPLNDALTDRRPECYGL